MKTKIIYSKALCNYLISKGINPIRSEVNIKDVNYRVFVFEETSELLALVEAYVQNKRLGREF